MSYSINKKDVRRAAQVLGNSFLDYPVFSFILPDRSYREKKIEFLFTFLINLGLLRGEVIATTSMMEGISIWIDSSSPKPSTAKTLWYCLIPLFLRVDPKSVFRFIRIGIVKSKVRRDILKGRYFLLDVIGVNPAYQNQGYARRMIESKLKEYDNQPHPCYLETSEKENIAFYEKFNFRLYHEYQLSATNIYCLLRESNLSENNCRITRRSSPTRQTVKHDGQADGRQTATDLSNE
jgi:ribosomal protein S18 acetylase RimI-like enzyme